MSDHGFLCQIIGMSAQEKRCLKSFAACIIHGMHNAGVDCLQT